MKLIISGTRDLPMTSTKLLSIMQLELGPEVANRCNGIIGWGDLEIVHGASGTVDMAAEGLKKIGFNTKPFPYPSEHGKQGGPIRNAKMAAYGDELLAIWDGRSPGTRNMIFQMIKQRKKFTVVFREAKK